MWRRALSGSYSKDTPHVGFHLACSLAKPFRAKHLILSSWPLRSFTMRMSAKGKILTEDLHLISHLSVFWSDKLCLIWPSHRYKTNWEGSTRLNINPSIRLRALPSGWYPAWYSGWYSTECPLQSWSYICYIFAQISSRKICQNTQDWSMSFTLITWPDSCVLIDWNAASHCCFGLILD